MIFKLKKEVKISPKSDLVEVKKEEINGGFKVIVPIGAHQATLYLPKEALKELRKYASS